MSSLNLHTNMPRKLHWALAIISVITIVEAVYQLRAFISLYRVHNNSHRSLLRQSFALYMFDYNNNHEAKDLKLRDFVTGDIYKKADPKVQEFVMAVNGSKTAKFWKDMEIIRCFIVIQNSLLLVASLLIYAAANINFDWSNNVFLVFILPWSILHVVVVITDTLLISGSVVMYLQCQLPSTCVYLDNLESPEKYKPFDAYVKDGGALYEVLTYTPLNFLVRACKRVVGTPILTFLLLYIWCVIFKLKREAKRALKNS